MPLVQHSDDLPLQQPIKYAMIITTETESNDNEKIKVAHLIMHAEDTKKFRKDIAGKECWENYRYHLGRKMKTMNGELSRISRSGTIVEFMIYYSPTAQRVVNTVTGYSMSIEELIKYMQRKHPEHIKYLNDTTWSEFEEYYNSN